MKRTLTLVAILITTAMLAIGCSGLQSTPTASLPTLAPSTAAPDNIAPTATEPAPEDMPTAAPLWTATPTLLPSAEESTPSVETTPAESTPVPPADSAQPLDASVVAVVNGTLVSRAAFDAQLAQAETYFVQQPGFDPASEAGQQSLLQLREQVLGWMIDQVLIQQAAAATGVSVAEAKIDAQVLRIKGNDAARFAAWLSANGLTEETMRDQIRLDLLTNAMRDRVTATLSRRTAQVHARHILVSTEEAAADALVKLQGGANFIALAREVSEDETTRASGGDLGFMPRGVMPPAFDEAAFALRPGEISGIVRSDFGFHLIQVVEIDPNRTVPEELWPVVQQRAFDDWLAQQRANANIQRNTDLVQG